MAPLNGDILEGCNSVGPSVDTHYKMRPSFFSEKLARYCRVLYNEIHSTYEGKWL